MALSFVRGGEGDRVDRVYVTRGDRSEVSFPIWPSVAGPPHDLAHLVVEGELGLDLGFWGCVAAGGQPPAVLSGRDPVQLLQAEAVVAVLTGHGSQGFPTDPDRVAAVHAACSAAGVPSPLVDEVTVARLRAALAAEAAAWAVLSPRQALRRSWPRPAV